ncbi:hypothetical protein [Stenotrophomonas sp. 24(2023)]|uniref:hypothetical protein n=1 Tax=Stenotrophomonas sp. 24(2023) TaxID=3068324 RepID=UPI0027E07307|nr:hypothetical protein [Stenotrophomonas sp. 24(2023)]WMJ70175.1 hypothetical protein Q9R17_03455 [Stenotrophomonas sp. 24(2023)]
MTAPLIDFAPAGWRRLLWQVSPAQWALLVLATLTSTAALGSAWYLQVQLQDQQRRTQRLQDQVHERQQRLRPARAPGVPAAQADAINAMVQQLNRPWNQLHQLLNDTASDHVALLSVAPDAPHHLLHITAEARDSDSMLTYLRQLQHHRFLEQVLLTHHEVDEQDPQHPLRFELEARWNTH